MTTIMKYLAPVLLLWVLVSLSDAQCYTKPKPSGNQTRCQDDVDMTWHPLGSLWRNSKCLDCDCTSCCVAYYTPTKFPKVCVSVFDPKKCKYIVHKKNDPSKLCPIFASVASLPAHS